jgi:2-keto-4-pentenoate hydratase/2-oxohepta-3-ene-1,7-dioic acid hydratase in catechol pathway
LQIGDLIYTGTPAGVNKIEIGDIYEGYIGDESLLKCEIK